MEREKAKTLKQLVALLAEIKNEDDAGVAGGEINWSFESEKITWQDHEMLYKILSKIYQLEEYKRIASGN